MRRVLLIPAGARPEDSELSSLPMDAEVWESGYSLVIDKRRQGLLQDFWRHYDGASAEMFLSGHRLLELHNDIMTVAPACASKQPMMRFLNDLGKMCLRAHSRGSGLQVIAD